MWQAYHDLFSDHETIEITRKKPMTTKRTQDQIKQLIEKPTTREGQLLPTPPYALTQEQRKQLIDESKAIQHSATIEASKQGLRMTLR